MYKVNIVKTTAYKDQKPGTSGLRKKVKVFSQPNYVENFIQCTFKALTNDKVEGSVICVGGDGRYYGIEAIKKLIGVAAGNGVRKVLVGQYGMTCTPAMSCLIRDWKEDNVLGAFILTASHNPGGPTEDFGIKYNCENGEPALEKITDEIFRQSSIITEYKTVDIPDIPLEKLDTHNFDINGKSFTVQVIDPVNIYADMLETIFNFDMIRSAVKRPEFSVCMDGMNGVVGPYAKEILINRLNMDPTCLTRCEPKEDFGGIHPDPNLVYNKYLVDLMGLPTSPLIGFACDGDADRNMVYGRQCFVPPSDSLAIITHYARQCIPWMKNRLTGVARSMPTSSSVDKVAKKLGLELYETPTGWKYFGNLMDANKIQICGEESFGTGGSHIREKDGMWAVLAWLSILAYENKDSKVLVTVKDILKKFYSEYGQCYYQRYDYEGVETDSANKVMNGLRTKLLQNVDAKYGLENITEFNYTDPVDGSVASNQGVVYEFEGGSRIVWRLSGTGSEGATIRMYIEKIVNKGDGTLELNELSEIGIILSDIPGLTGRKEPTVIT